MKASVLSDLFTGGRVGGEFLSYHALGMYAMKHLARTNPTQEGGPTPAPDVPCPRTLPQPFRMRNKGPFALGDNDILLSVFFVVRSEIKKWVASDQ